MFATHELTKSRVRAKNQVVVFAAYECTNSQTNDIKKKDAALVFVASTHEVTIFPEKGVLGLFATTNQLAKSEKNQAS